MTGPRSIDAPAPDDRAKVRVNVFAGLNGYVSRIRYADELGISIENPPASLSAFNGALFMHRGTETPSGMPCYYEVEA